MKKILVVALTTVGLLAPAVAAPTNPFPGDHGMITLRDGSIESAALPAVDFDNYNEVIGRLNIVGYTIGELQGGGVQIIVNQCTGKDAVLANARPFLFFGHVSQFILCGN